MNPNAVIESYVLEVMRRLPGKDRNEVGLELRDLLTEMLTDKAQVEGKPADDAMVLSILRDFGSPADIAERYRPPGTVIIPASQTRSFALFSVGGVGLQWALTLPQVFEGQPLAAWWLSWGLGAFWWPGFMVMMALIGLGLRRAGLFKTTWRPRNVDPERVHRGAMACGLVAFALGAGLVISLPWIAALLPAPMPEVFALDPEFLQQRAWPVLLLWAASFAILATVMVQGRWSPLTRRLEIASSLGFIVLLVWWLTAGDIFQAPATNQGARAAIALVVLIILMDLAYKLYRQRTRIRPLKLAE